MRLFKGKSINIPEQMLSGQGKQIHQLRPLNPSQHTDKKATNYTYITL